MPPRAMQAGIKALSLGNKDGSDCGEEEEEELRQGMRGKK